MPTHYKVLIKHEKGRRIVPAALFVISDAGVDNGTST